MEIVVIAEQGGNIEHYIKTLSFVPGGDSRNRFDPPPPNTDRWTDGFHIFMAIWLSANVTNGPAMAQYAHHIPSSSRNQKSTQKNADFLDQYI